jgi:hypothetical protein
MEDFTCKGTTNCTKVTNLKKKRLFLYKVGYKCDSKARKIKSKAEGNNEETELTDVQLSRIA